MEHESVLFLLFPVAKIVNNRDREEEKMKTRSLLLKVLLVIFIAAATCMSLIGCAGDQNAEPPTLNVTGVPSEGTVGRVISLPAATAAKGRKEAMPELS